MKKIIISLLALIFTGMAIAADGYITQNDYRTQTEYKIKVNANGDGTYSQGVQLSTHSKMMLWDGATTSTVDEDTNALVIIPEEHHQAHVGKAYRCVATFRELSPNATAYVLIRTTPTHETHINFSYNVGGNFIITLSSAPSVSSTGAELTVANLNQQDNSTIPANTKIYKPSISSPGTNIVDEIFIEGGSGPQSTGAGGSGAVEWILTGGEDYLVLMQNYGSNAKTISLIMSFYEVEE